MREKQSMAHGKKTRAAQSHLWFLHQQNEPKNTQFQTKSIAFSALTMVTPVHKKRPFSWTQ
jgi:sulfur transfer protein SufE